MKTPIKTPDNIDKLKGPKGFPKNRKLTKRTISVDDELAQQREYLMNKKKAGKFPGELTVATPIITQESQVITKKQQLEEDKNYDLHILNSQGDVH